jgi:hypothetical protein
VADSNISSTDGGGGLLIVWCLAQLKRKVKVQKVKVKIIFLDHELPE